MEERLNKAIDIMERAVKGERMPELFLLYIAKPIIRVHILERILKVLYYVRDGEHE